MNLTLVGRATVISSGSRPPSRVLARDGETVEV
jgi:hypothetical protein